MTTTNENTLNIKVIKELNKIKSTAPKKYKKELNKWIKIIGQEGYILSYESTKRANERLRKRGLLTNNENPESPEAIARRCYEQTKKLIAKRENYAAYGITEKITPGELITIWCSNPKLRVDLMENFQWFVTEFLEAFPRNPMNFCDQISYLRKYPVKKLDAMIKKKLAAMIKDIKQTRNSPKRDCIFGKPSG